MVDVIEVFLGEMKCTLERFEPKPGDVFVFTVPHEISLEEEERIKSGWMKRFPETKALVVVGGMTVALDKEAKN